MRIASVATALLLLACLVSPPFASAEAGRMTSDLPEHDASDPGAAPVTADGLEQASRFWPFRVAVREAWTAPGTTKTIRPELPGVLVRVEPGGFARIDFGRDGVHWVPVAETDLLERANAIRLGSEPKTAPNFLYMVAPRLLDSRPGSLGSFDYAEVAAHERYLLVFADVTKPGFAELAASLRAVAGREDLLPIVFPQGRVEDVVVRDRLRELEFEAAFVYDHLSEGYSQALLESATPMPAVMVVDREGRAEFGEPWSARTEQAFLGRLAGAASPPRAGSSSRSR